MRFFIATPLGFEESVREELLALWPQLLTKSAQPLQEPVPEIKILKGGLEIECDLFIGVQWNFFLKSANRVLLRVAEFKAKDLPTFYNQFKKVPWREYFTHSQIEISVAAQTSRVNNEKRLLASAQAVFTEIFGPSEREGMQAGVFIRMERDLCTVSVDTTGEHLHKRGWGQFKGEAPLRETLAAFMLTQMLHFDSGRTGITLVDPMMGSGTYLYEAAGWNRGHFARSYAFQAWPKAPKLFLAERFHLNYKTLRPQPFQKLLGMDLSEKMVSAAKQNLEQVQRAPGSEKLPTCAAHLQQGDALSGEVLLPTQAWMIVNPPYGERLEEASLTLQDLVRTLTERYRPELLGVLYPEAGSVLKSLPHGRVVKQIKINNGGIRCLFTILAAV